MIYNSNMNNLSWLKMKMDIREWMTDKAGDTYWDYGSHIKKNKQTKKQMNHLFGKFLSTLLCWHGAHHFVSIPWYFQILSCMHFSTGQLLKQIQNDHMKLVSLWERMNDKNNENRTHPGKWYRRARIWKILTLDTF